MLKRAEHAKAALEALARHTFAGRAKGIILSLSTVMDPRCTASLALFGWTRAKIKVLRETE